MHFDASSLVQPRKRLEQALLRFRVDALPISAPPEADRAIVRRSKTKSHCGARAAVIQASPDVIHPDFFKPGRIASRTRPFLRDFERAACLFQQVVYTTAHLVDDAAHVHITNLDLA